MYFIYISTRTSCISLTFPSTTYSSKHSSEAMVYGGTTAERRWPGDSNSQFFWTEAPLRGTEMRQHSTIHFIAQTHSLALQRRATRAESTGYSSAGEKNQCWGWAACPSKLRDLVTLWQWKEHPGPENTEPLRQVCLCHFGALISESIFPSVFNKHTHTCTHMYIQISIYVPPLFCFGRHRFPREDLKMSMIHTVEQNPKMF